MTYSELRQDVEANRHILVNGQYMLLFEYRENKSARHEAIAGIVLVAIIGILFYAAAYIGG